MVGVLPNSDGGRPRSTNFARTTLLKGSWAELVESSSLSWLMDLFLGGDFTSGHGNSFMNLEDLPGEIWGFTNELMWIQSALTYSGSNLAVPIFAGWFLWRWKKNPRFCAGWIHISLTESLVLPSVQCCFSRPYFSSCLCSTCAVGDKPSYRDRSTMIMNHPWAPWAVKNRLPCIGLLWSGCSSEGELRSGSWSHSWVWIFHDQSLIEKKLSMFGMPGVIQWWAEPVILEPSWSWLRAFGSRFYAWIGLKFTLW